MSSIIRPGLEHYFMNIAREVATRSTCRTAVGAVLVNNDEVIATAYNGAPRDQPHCLDHGCVMMTEGGRERCVRAVHAELNLLLKTPRSTGDIIFCTHSPCIKCAQAMIQRRVERVYFSDYYEDDRWEHPDLVSLITGLNLLRVV